MRTIISAGILHPAIAVSILISILISASPLNGSATDYLNIKRTIETQRLRFLETYNGTIEKSKKDSILDRASIFLFNQLTNTVFPSWYGTRWSFNGTTTIPRMGSIACGYFVTTTLKDAGLRIPRVRWAQAASETMIRSITHRGNIKRYHNASMARIKSDIKTWGNGLYIVGLDYHTGFVINKGGKIYFVHSGYSNNFLGVVSESIDENTQLTYSAYRVFGKILDRPMMLKWIRGQHY
ncbi:MAG: hypothetical protein IH946_02385 [Bacteroidetes bacterium]|nr:hypothetical protein [Bacteroidota bacterium]